MTSPAVPLNATENPAHLCSKCEHQLDTEGYPLWCKACRNKYQKEANELRKQMERSRSYLAGAQALREMLCQEFERLGSGGFSGYEIAAIIRQARVTPTD